MSNPFRFAEATAQQLIPGDINVLAYITGAERRDSVWLDGTLATADSAGNKYYEKGQVCTKRAGTGKWSFPESGVLSGSYDAAAPKVGVLVTRVNVGFGDAPGAMYVGFCTFDVSALRNYIGNETDIAKHLPTCQFYTVSQVPF